MLLVSSERGLSEASFDYKQSRLKAARTKADWIEQEDEILRHCRRELDEYFGGKRREFTVPLDLK